MSTVAVLTVGGMTVLWAGPASAADTTPPTEPGAITVSALTATSATLTWTKSTDNVSVEGYRVYRGPAAAANSALTLISTRDVPTPYSATHLFSGTGYKFGIVAIDAANNKSVMRTVTLRTSARSDKTAPAAPASSSVSVTAFSSSRLDVFWAASASTDAAAYQVLRDGVVIATVTQPAATRYSDNGLAASSIHVYSIKTVDSNHNVSAATSGRSASTPAAGTLLITRGPYLSKVFGTTAVVSWWTNLPTRGVATWGTTSPTMHSASDPAGQVQHHSVTLTGLTAGTTYQYRVGNGAGLVTATATFATAAPAGTTYSFAAIGDFGGGSTGLMQNAANIAGAGTQFIQTLGDNIYPSSGNPDPNFTTTYSDFDARFYKPFAAAIRKQAFFPANGNQEYYGDGVFWKNFPMPGSNHSWYSYRWGSAHILVLDTEQPVTVGSPQYAFAQADLAAHQGDRWRIVVMQRPPYSSTSANSSSKPARASLVPLFQASHVNLVLSGNSHNYERTKPMTNGAAATGGVTYIVSGGGGNGFNVFSSAAPAYTAFREATFYEYVKVTVSAASLKVDAIRAGTKAVFDTTTIP
jgi:Purple acid Phosphatase, N-terminal domain/Iron/zinc purple acid phosphatase-like protein C/Fibronectin type III domain